MTMPEKKGIDQLPPLTRQELDSQLNQMRLEKENQKTPRRGFFVKVGVLCSTLFGLLGLTGCKKPEVTCYYVAGPEPESNSESSKSTETQESPESSEPANPSNSENSNTQSIQTEKDGR